MALIRSALGILSLSTILACSGSSEVHPGGESETPAARIEVAAEWPLFRGDPGQRGIAAGSLPDELGVLWSFDVGAAITSSPVISGGRVYFGADDYKLHALDFASGEELWAFETEDIIEAPPLVVSGSVYIGSSDFSLYAVDAESGVLRWKQETDDRILGGANRVQGPAGQSWIVVGSYDTQLYCFDALSGERQWTYKTDNYVNGTPAVFDNQIVFGGCDAVLHVVDARTGEASEKIEIGDSCHIAGSVALADGKAYFGHYGNAFVRVDLLSGAIDWSYGDGQNPFFSSPAVGGERVVFGGRDKALHCVWRDDGKELWSFPTRRKVDGSPVICGGKVVFGSGDGWLYVLDLESGRELWSYETGQAIFSSPAVAGGVIVVGSNDGRLYAFGEK